MGDYEDEDLDFDRRPISKVEHAFQRFQTARAKSIVAEEKYKAIKRRRGVPESAIVKFRSDSRNTLRQEQAAAQGLFTESVAAIPDNPLLNIYEKQALDAMSKTVEKLDELNHGGSRRKRNKSRNKVYSAHKKSKRRRVKSTRRRHKKSTMHHRRKY